MNPDSLSNQIEGMKMLKEAEELAKLLADREIQRMKARARIRGLLSDKSFTELLRAQAWLEADPSKVTCWKDGKVDIAAEGWPLGCGSHESEVTARLQRRLFPDDDSRESFAWLFEEGD